MSWQDDHQKEVDGFPTDVKDAHSHSSNHRAELEQSTVCGCFYCGARFPPSDVAEWTDEGPDGQGQTAICPKCGIDSVIGDKSGFEISPEFLATLTSYWF